MLDAEGNMTLYHRAGVPNHLVHGLIGTWLHSRRWAVGEQAKLHLYLQLLPIITTWAPPLVRSAVALDSYRSVNPTVNCACEGSRSRAPYENLMPDDLRWSWGGEASAGKQLQIQIIMSREVWLHRDHNKSMCLNHPETIILPSLVHGKIVFHETGPWCQKGWGLLP